MFYALIRKDLRLYRSAIIVAVIVAVFCEAIVPAIGLWMRSQRLGLGETAFSAPRVWREIYSGAFIAAAISCGLAAVFGCAAETVERRERWAELATMLPVSRARRTLARLTVALLLTAAPLGCHITLAAIADHYASHDWQRFPHHFERFAIFAVGMFGLAWLAGAFLKSPAIAASAAIATVIGAFMLTRVMSDWSYGITGQWPNYDPIYFVVTLIVGIAAAVIGTVVGLRRVEP